METQIYKSGRIFVALWHRIIFLGLLQIPQIHFLSHGGGGYNYPTGHSLIIPQILFIFTLKAEKQID